MGERVEAKISNLENEVVVMRPIGNKPNKASSYDWPLIRLIGVVLVVGFIWYLRTQQNLEIEAANALADKKTKQEDVQSQEQKQREAYYQGMNEKTLNNQEQEAENARVAWENYNEAQRLHKVNDILAMEQQSSNNVYQDTPAPTQATVNTYWKCTDNTGITTYSTEPCHIEAKQTPQNTERAFIPTQKEIKIVDTQNVSVVHNPTPAPKVITKTVVVYRNASNEPNLNKMNSLACQNAKRAYKFEKGSYFGKSFNKERIIKDVWTQCGGWPSDLEG